MRKVFKPSKPSKGKGITKILLSAFVALLFVSVVYGEQPATAETTTSDVSTPETSSSDASISEAPTPAPLNKWYQLYLDRVELFREENKTLNPEDRPIVFAGDSITQHMRVKELFPEELVLNRGIATDGTADLPNAQPPHYRGLVNRYEESILDARPRVLFILMGTNDVGRRSIELTYWAEQLEGLIDRVEKDLPDCKIVIQTLPPTGPPYPRVESLNSRAKEYNELLKELAERRGLPVIDLWEIYATPEGILPSDLSSDGLHLKREAYDVWAAAARPYFTKEVASTDGQETN